MDYTLYIIIYIIIIFLLIICRKTMFNLLIRLCDYLVNLLSEIDSIDNYISYDEHWYDRTVTSGPHAPGGWCNIHGFRKDDIYYIGFDFRSFGIRVQDVLIECKNRSICYDYINKVVHLEGIVNPLMEDSRLNAWKGDDTNTNYHFTKDGEETKNFNIHYTMDRYAVEKYSN